MTRTLLAATLSTLVFAAPAFAADAAKDTNEAPVTVNASVAPTTIASAVAAEAAAAPLAAAPAAAATVTPDWWLGKRPAALPALYAGSALLQAYDAYSTLKALRMGGHEANPMMQGATANPLVFVGIKAAVATATILSAERMWKDHHRTGAVITMIASNGFMAWVAAHNASVVAGLR